MLGKAWSGKVYPITPSTAVLACGSSAPQLLLKDFRCDWLVTYVTAETCPTWVLVVSSMPVVGRVRPEWVAV